MDQQSNCVLGALGLLRLLLPQLIRGYSADYQDDSDSVTDAGQQQLQQQKQQHQQAASAAAATTESRQIIEIYDYCLHLLSTQHTTNHAIINAALEVINGILQALDGANGMPAAAPTAAAGAGESLGQSLRQLLCNQQLEHNEYLRRRKSLKNQIFQLKNYQLGASQQQQAAMATATATSAEAAAATRQMQMQKNSNAELQQQQECQQQQQRQRRQQSGSNLLQVVGINAVADDADTEKDAAASSVPDEGKVNNALQVELSLCLCVQSCEIVTCSQTDKRTDRQRDRATDRQTDWQTGRQWVFGRTGEQIDRSEIKKIEQCHCQSRPSALPAHTMRIRKLLVHAFRRR